MSLTLDPVALGSGRAPPSVVVGVERRSWRRSSPAQYRGPERRTPLLVSRSGPSPAALAAASLLLIVAGGVASLDAVRGSGAVPAASLGTGFVVIDTVAATVAILTALVAQHRWRVTADALAARISAALVVVAGLVIVEPIVTQAMSRTAASPVTAPGLSGRLVVAGLVVLALRAPEVDARLRPCRLAGRAIVVVEVGALALLAVPAVRNAALSVDGAAVPVLGVLVPVGWWLLGAACWIVGLRRPSARLQWLGLALLAAGFADLALLGYDTTAGQAYGRLLRLFAATVALYSFVAEVRSILLGQLERDVETRHVAGRSVDRLIQQRQQHHDLTHDAASALLTIDGAVSVLRKHELAEPDADQLLACVAAEIDRLQRMLAGSSAGDRPAPYDLATLLTPMVGCYQAAGHRVTVSGLAVGQCLGRETDTAEVIQNLVENALRHAPGASIAIDVARQGDRVGVTVTDDGPGIAPTARTGIFERGRRGEGSVGSGVGLAVARRLVEAQGGRLDLVDTARGASFRLDLPAAPGEAGR